MSVSEGEELFLRSLEATLEETDRLQLKNALEQSSELAERREQLMRLRNILQRQEAESFGPFFAERIAYRISQLKKEVDYQIFFFFKKYQLLAAGIIIALLVLNILVSDQLSLKSILGFEEEAIEDVLAIDVYSTLTK